MALGATYGITWMAVQALGWGEITYYIPFAAAVLLLSLGSDYTIFVVGRIWEAARTAPSEEAVIDAAPRASGSITVAGPGHGDLLRRAGDRADRAAARARA